MRAAHGGGGPRPGRRTPGSSRPSAERRGDRRQRGRGRRVRSGARGLPRPASRSPRPRSSGPLVAAGTCSAMASRPARNAFAPRSRRSRRRPGSTVHRSTPTRTASAPGSSPPWRPPTCSTAGSTSRSRTATEARRLAEAVGDRATEHDADATLGVCFVFAGRMDEGWSTLERAIARSRLDHLEAEAARAYRMLGSCASVLVEYDRAEKWLRDGIKEAERHELWNHRHYMAAHLAHVAWATGAGARPTTSPVAPWPTAAAGSRPGPRRSMCSATWPSAEASSMPPRRRSTRPATWVRG